MSQNVELVSYKPNDSAEAADEADDSKPNEEAAPNYQSEANPAAVDINPNEEGTPNNQLEANNAAIDNKQGADGVPYHQPADNTDNATVIIVPDSNAAVRFSPDGDGGSVDVASSPKDVVPSTSAAAVVKAEKGAEATATRAKKTDKEEEEEKTDVVGVFELFRFATKLDVLMMLVGGVCAIAHGVSMPLLMVFFGQTIDSFIKSGQIQHQANVTQDAVAAAHELLQSETKRLSIIFAGVGFGVLIVGYVRVALWLVASYRQTFRIRLALLQAVLRQEIGWFDTNDAGELGTRLSE